jgi:hypothetical protein
MKVRVLGIKTLGSIAAAAFVALTPLVVQAAGPAANSATTKSADSLEIAALKQQIYMCHHHKHHRRAACALPVKMPQVIEKQTIIERPVIIEKVVEKQVFVERPAAVEKPVLVEMPVEVEQRVLVEHSKHRKHLLHFGIPLISVNLF